MAFTSIRPTLELTERYPSAVKSKTLRQPPALRTPEQIQTAMFGLQSLPSFAEYPLHMQEKLTKVAWFEIVSPMRTIIRQGHFAENFYFILSGQALVTIHKPGEASAQTAAMMRKGTSFGELALLHHSRRTATVTSHDTVQLLSVGRDDFFDIFMAGHGLDEMPEHIRFISQLDFMKEWPLQRLLERPDQCLLHFFKRNMVILKDSSASEWFYVVKTGSCQVLKQLKGVTGRIGPSQHRLGGRESRCGRMFQTDTGLPKYSNLDTGRHHMKKRQSQFRLTPPYLSPQTTNEHTRLSLKSGSLDGFGEADPNSSTKKKLDTMRSFSKLRYSKDPTTGPAHFRSSKHTTRDRPSSRQAYKENSTNSEIRRESYISPRKHRNLEPDDNKMNLDQLPGETPVFVQVELLKPKDVFGLDLVNFDNSGEPDTSSVSLVSLGAECIMLSKSFFMKHANDRVKKRFSEMVKPYPNEESLQESLQNKANWEVYKKSLLAQLTAPKPTGLRGQTLKSGS